MAFSYGATATPLKFKRTPDGWLAEVDTVSRTEFAAKDGLTSLPNRAMFYRDGAMRLVDAMASDDALAVLLLGIDRFRETNERLGHEAGDQVLAALGASLSAAFPEATLARYGGDEFAVILPMAPTAAGLLSCMASVQACVSGTDPVWQGKPVPVAVSIGASCYPQDGVSLVELLSHADIALAQAKSTGRGTSLAYQPAMGEVARRRILLGDALRHAFDNNELTLYYQPQVSYASGAVEGVEALLRWTSPRFGQVPPDLAFALAEESGLDIKLSDWVLQTACEQLVSWRAQGLAPDRLAVNMSARVLESPGFIERAHHILVNTGAPPEKLEIEVTETATIGRSTGVVLTKLREMGLGVALDDFGTGFSNLAVLGSLPLTKLKLDKLFVREMENGRMRLVAANVTALAKGLGLQVVMEGVEHYAHQEFAKKIGANLIQGYLFSQPMPADKLCLVRTAGHLTLAQKEAA
jgi:diguanylate cyclase (GGDEF)-like protein